MMNTRDEQEFPSLLRQERRKSLGFSGWLQTAETVSRGFEGGAGATGCPHAGQKSRKN